MKNNYPRWYFWTLIVSLLALDQLTKFLILKNFALHETRVIISGFFNLTYLTNDGIAWGLLRGNNLLLGVIVSVIVVAAIFYARKLNWRSPEINILAASLSAGAVGNLIDRFAHGHVIDFVDVIVPLTNSYHWPAFNVADSCISLCVVWLLYRALFQNSDSNKIKPPSSAP